MFYILLLVCLVGGIVIYKGCVEIFFNGVWGMICYDFWELLEVNVICC